MQLSQKQKQNFHFSPYFLLLDDILHIFLKKMILMADVFRKLRTLKNMIW